MWAPERREVAVVLDGVDHPLTREAGGYFSGVVESARAGSRYRYRLDGGGTFPDPASRFQPEGPHGPSEVIDTRALPKSAGWRGVPMADAVIYEMHIGTFTREGTWRGAIGQLRPLAELGVTVLEVMPVAEYPGSFGWGYDGVGLYAPTRLYGRPEDFAAFIEAAHELGMAVILDVVYNHLGPDGNYLAQFSPAYFTDRYTTDWGAAINFDGPDAGPVREFYRENAAFWVREYGLDGLRLDATQNIYDASGRHILGEINAAVRTAAAGRTTIIVAENEPQETNLVRPPERGGFGFDGLWNDDYHHSANVVLTARNEAYYTDYLGRAQEFVSAMKYGYLYQGQRYKWQSKRRGTPAFDLPREAFVTFLENHDQVANSGRGLRIHQLSSPGRFRALTALTLLGPGTPMLFQGQEFNSSAPFLFFADHHEELATLVDKGRREFMSQFRSVATREMQDQIDVPSHRRTFERCILDHSERERNRGVWELHRDVLRLRRSDAVLRRRQLDGAVLSEAAFVLRFFGERPGDDRLLVVNLGHDLHLDPAPEPLLAPPAPAGWRIVISTEHPTYGGGGTPALETEENWRLPGETAVLLGPAEEEANA